MEGGYRLTGHRRNYAQSIFFTLFMVVALYTFLRSPLFMVKRIEVNGNRLLPAAQIVSISGLTTGENIFRLDLAKATRRLKSLPAIQEVTIRRSLPGTLVITVRERQPVAVLPAGKNYVEVDAHGFYLRRLDFLGQAEVPVITGVDVGGSWSPGQRIKARGLAEILTYLRDFPADFINRLSEGHVSEDGSITFYTMSGIEVRFGSPDQLATKVATLENILGQLQSTGPVAYIDLSYSGSPVIKYKYSR